MRFKDLEIGTMFTMILGGSRALCQKTAVNIATVEKLNSPGFVEFKINPDLNEDDVTPSAQAFRGVR